MGYTHGKKWDEQKIINTLTKVKNALYIDRMPSKSEVEEYCGDKSLSCAVSKHGGWAYFSKVMGLPMKNSCTTFGDENEQFIIEKIKSLGYDAIKTKVRHPYDILVNGIVKIDVKSAHLYKRDGREPVYSFAINNEQPKCDIFICVAIKDDGEDIYVIPSHFIKQHQL